ncbi:hypothetical protein ACET3Z_019630 [Daucus carota]
MRFLHNRKFQYENTTRLFCCRHFKWLLWFALSSYFFISFLISHTPNPVKPVSSSSSKASISRVVIEPHIPLSHQGLLNGMKVFVYDLPSKYNNAWLSNERCKNHLFASEVAIHKALLTTSIRTLDPTQADFFFVPVYVSCNFSTINGFPAIGHARSLLSSAVHLISTEYPFWNRSRGSDHVFVASHDYGACFHAMEDVAMSNGIPEFMRNSIILQTFGVKYKHPCQQVQHVVIPPYISPISIQSTLRNSPINIHRDIFAFFRGKMEVHPKNISGRFYGKGARTKILRKYGNDRRFYLKRHRFAGYQLEILRSIFCLCTLGWAPWSPRLVEPVALGCVPVIIADGIRLPFSSVVRWPKISLTVAEKDVGKLGEILEQVALTNLSVIQSNLWAPETKQALLYNVPMEEGDATWQVLSALFSKLSRSRNSVSSE